MITDEDARKMVLRLRALSIKHRVTDPDHDAYSQGQHDGRDEAYALAARMVEDSNREEADGE